MSSEEAEQLSAATDERFKAAFPDEDMTSGGRLFAFNIVEHRGGEAIELSERKSTKKTSRKDGFTVVEPYSDDVTDDDILQGDLERIRFDAILRLAKTRSNGEIAAAVNEHHPDVEFTSQQVYDRLISAYFFVAQRDERSKEDVKADLEAVRQSNVVEKRRAKGK